MPEFSNVLQTVRATAITGCFAVAGAVTASADPATTGSSSDINTLAATLSKGYGLNHCTPDNIDIAALYRWWRANG